MEQIISRQFAISEGNAEPLPLPDYDTYAICNLRGGIGKSSLWKLFKTPISERWGSRFV